MAAELSRLRYWLKATPATPKAHLRCERLEDRLTPTIGFSFSGAYSLALANESTAISLTGNETETAIAINPTAPGNLVVLTNNGFTNREVTAHSSDAGATWGVVTIGNSVDTLSNGGDRFDGTTAADRFGNIHVIYEHRNGSIVYAFSSDGGQTYQGRVLSVNASGDKPWLAVGPDALDPSHDAVWVTYQHPDASNFQQIFTRATTVSGLGGVGGFTPEVQVSTTGKKVNYAIPSVGPKGQVAITYQGNNGVQTSEPIFVVKDVNGLVGGVTFGSEVLVTSSNGGSFDYNAATPDRSYFAEPYLAYDRSGGVNSGRLYMVYVDEPVDESGNNVILVRHSDNNGATWSAAVQASDTAIQTRMFSTASVDQTTGFLYISWYDARNDRADGGLGDSDTDGTPNDEVQYFGTASTDGGATFLANVQLSSGTSNQRRADPDGNDFGDYTGIDAFGGSAFSSWADNGAGREFDTHVRRFVLRSDGGETVTATAAADGASYLIRLDASGTFMQFYENGASLTGTPTFTSTLSAMNNIVINGGDGDDTITIDMSNGNPIPLGGLTINGGGGINSLHYLHSTGAGIGSANDPRSGIIFRPTGAFSGELNIANASSNVYFDNINGALDFTVPRDTFTVLAPSSAGFQSDYYEIAAGSGIDTVTVSDAGVSMTDATLGALRSVSFNSLATLYVRGGNELGKTGDTFIVTPSTKVNIVVDAMAPYGTSPGDILVVNATGDFTLATGTAAQGPAQIRYNQTQDGASFGFIGFGTIPFQQITAAATVAGVVAEVRAVENSGSIRWAVHPFDGFSGSVSIAVGDINGDGFRDVVVGAGPGAGPRVVVLSGVDGSQLASFFAFAPGFVGGVTVAAGDINGDGIDDIIVGADTRGNSHIKVFDGKTLQEIVSFIAFRADYAFGITVAAGDVNADGFAEIFVGGGFGALPQFRIFDIHNIAILQDRMIFAPEFAGGISIAAGDVDGDGFADAIIGSGRATTPQVVVISGNTGAQLASFYVNEVFAPTAVPSIPLEDSISVGAADLDGDGIDEILVGKGAGTRAAMRIFKVARRERAGSTTFTGIRSVGSYSIFDDYFGGIVVGG